MTAVPPARNPSPDPFSRTRPTRPTRRLVFALSRASMLALVVAVTAAAVVISPIGTRRTARVTTEREIDALLAPDERILARAFASQRRPSDLWRLSHGLLVATDRRVLYLGAPPVTLLRPADGGPQALYLESWPFNAAFTIDVEQRDEGNGHVLLRTPMRMVLLRVDARDIEAAHAVRGIAERERRLASEEADRLLRAGSPTLLPDRYTTHMVQRGETLTSIARRYTTSIDILRQLNGLRSDALRAGQRLRVPEPIEPRDPFGEPPEEHPQVGDSLTDYRGVGRTGLQTPAFLHRTALHGR